MSRVERIKDLHARALELDTEERAAFLQEECGDDAKLRAEVESLLEAFEEMGGFLETSAVDRLKVQPEFGPGDRVGSYEIVRVIGAGGAGTVYEAMQARPHRRVALKVVRARRSEAEAEMLARVTHPAIAAVYEAGTHDEFGYFAMEYVTGARALTDFARGLPLDDRLELVAQIADAIHHGHEQGIVHRDIKPGNLLVDVRGQPKVIDFGIAQVEGPAREIAGTAHYMSPEQRVAGDIDARTDVYALGVVLDELAPESHGELGAIVHKACAEDRGQRYASAAALADDLRRYLQQRPVAAVGGGPLYRARKFLWRRRAAVAFAGIVAVGAGALSLRGDDETGSDSSARRAELRALVARLVAADDALDANQREKAQGHLEEVPAAMRNWEWRHLHGRLDLSARTVLWPGHELAGISAVSADGRFGASSGFTRERSNGVRLWILPGTELGTLRTGARTVYSIAFGPDGKRVAFGYFNGEIEIQQIEGTPDVRRWRAHTGNITQMLFLERALITASADRTIKFWNPAGALLKTLVAHEDRVVCLALHGQRLASGGRDGLIRIWNLETDEPPVEIRRHGESVAGIAFSPDGKRIASTSWDHRVRLWDLATREMIASHASHTDVARSVVYSPDGKTFASASYDGTVRLWDGVTGDEITCFRGDTKSVYTVHYLPARRQLVSFSIKGLHFWDLRERDGGTELDAGKVDAIAFSPDGRRLAASADGAITAWDLETGEPSTWDGPLDPSTTPDILRDGQTACIALDPDGELFAVGTVRGAVGIWGKKGPAQIVGLPETGVPVRALAFASNRLAVLWEDGTARIFDAFLDPIADVPGEHVAIDLSPDGTRLASGGNDVRLWDTETGTEVYVLETGAPVSCVAFSPDDESLAAGAGAKIRIWKAR